MPKSSVIKGKVVDATQQEKLEPVRGEHEAPLCSHRLAHVRRVTFGELNRIRDPRFYTFPPHFIHSRNSAATSLPALRVHHSLAFDEFAFVIAKHAFISKAMSDNLVSLLFLIPAL